MRIKYAFFKYGTLRNAERLDSSFYAGAWERGKVCILQIWNVEERRAFGQFIPRRSVGTREYGTLRNAERSYCIPTPERGNEGKWNVEERGAFGLHYHAGAWERGKSNYSIRFTFEIGNIFPSGKY